ncbi:MAG: protein kinase domain-containing protein [Planctomycetota bacterium]
MEFKLKDIEVIYHTALEKDVAQERSAYLDSVCGKNTALRIQVEALLKANEEVGNFLESPGFGVDITLDKSPITEGLGTIVGRYKLLEKIGEGGMAVVYMAEQQQPIHRKIALKIIKLGMDTKSVIARFEAERQALAMMDHPNIAKVLDAGSTDTGRPYFVMELVRGVPITEFCDKNMLSTQERLDLFIQVCNAVQHAHQKGIIHRDIKPSNIMVALHDDSSVPKVIDFGIARATNQRLTEKTLFTRYTQMIGTPVYMSPEQAQFSDLDIDTRTDIYSLGVLLYELLTGTTPVDSEELRSKGYAEIQRIIQEEDPPKPSTKLSTMGDALTGIAAYRQSSPDSLRKSVKGDLDWIVMKCLEKDRKRRFETTNELAADIKRHLDNEPIVARPPSAIYRFQKAWHRNKVVYTATIVVAIALLLGTGISVWQAWIANAARERAVQEERKAKEGERKQRLIAYASDMRLAQEYLKENNLGKVLETLNRYMPGPGQEDLRGMAWRYLWQASRGDEIHTFPHESMVRCISLSDDGTRLASISMDRKIRLFDVVSRRLLWEQDGGSTYQWDGSVALSPDGQLLAVDQQGTLNVWNADNGELIFGQKNVVAPIGFSPDARYLAGVTEAGLRVWNTTDWTSRLLGEPLVIKIDKFNLHRRSLTFTPDSDRIIFCPNQWIQKLMVWNLTDSTMEGELTSPTRPIAISTDGSIVAASDWDGNVCVWDLVTREVIKEFKAHQCIIKGIALSPDGKTIATGGSDQIIRLWDTKTFENTRSLKGHRSEVWNLKFSRNGRVLASAGKDNSVKLWQWNTQPDTEWDYLVPHNLYGRGFSASGDVLRFYDPNEWSDFDGEGEILPPEERPLDFGVPRPRTDHFLDLTTGHWTHVTRSDSEAIAQATSMMKWESGQDTELFGKQDGTVVISDGMTTQSIHVADHPVQPLLLSPKGRHLLLNVLPKNADPYAILWDIEAQGIVGKFTMMEKSRYPMRQAISPDERFLAYDGNDYAVKLWQIPQKRQWATLKGHTWHLSGFGFSPDSRLLASFSWDGDCRLWDVEKGTKANPHLLRSHRAAVGQAIFSPDGRTLATWSDDSLFKLWSVETGQELLSLSAPRVFFRFESNPMMAAKADRLVWAGYPEGYPLPTPTGHIPLRVTTLPSLAEIDEEIKRQSSSKVSLGSGYGQD